MVLGAQGPSQVWFLHEFVDGQVNSAKEAAFTQVIQESTATEQIANWVGYSCEVEFNSRLA